MYSDVSPSGRACRRPAVRVILATLPVADVDDNAAMVNALQRHARVIVQKSLAEGFGLTVAEGMWKGRPVVGSAVGGIQDQVADGTGILLPDPTDLAAFGRARHEHCWMTRNSPTGLGAAAQEYVRAHYVGDQHLLRYAELFGTLLRGRARPQWSWKCWWSPRLPVVPTIRREAGSDGD